MNVILLLSNDNKITELLIYASISQVWDACSDAMITFNEEHLAEELAYIVENDLLLHAVDRELSSKDSVDVVHGAKVEDILLPDQQGQDARITLQNGQRFKTKLLVSVIYVCLSFIVCRSPFLGPIVLPCWSTSPIGCSIFQHTFSAPRLTR